MMHLSFPGVLHKIKWFLIWKHWWKMIKCLFWIPLFLTVDILYFMGLIFSNAIQCPKSSYFKLVTSTLLPHKLFIYNYWSIPYLSQSKYWFPNYMNAILPILLDDPGIRSIILDFSLFFIFVSRNVYRCQISIPFINYINFIKQSHNCYHNTVPL